MSQPVCVNCQNKKTVNLTDNRLVTENCGHIKCIECLVQEKSGCLACLQETSVDESLEIVIEVPSIEDSEKKKSQEDIKKQKPETSHIEVSNDENGKCFLCTVCKKKFHARSQVHYHAYCNGQRKPYQCPECSKTFATQSHFKYHMQVHRNERTYSCEDCGESFFQMSKLQRHRLKHTKEKKHVCPECNKAFSDHTTLRKHSLLHTEQRPYLCPCGRAFKDASNFRRHRAKHDVIHQPNGKCQCAVCGRTAGSMRSLAAHARAHCVPERRAFPCPRCPAAFHSKKDLRRHSAVHTDSKPFRCKVCNRRFRRKDNLERHIRNTHPDSTPATAVECDEGEILTNGQQTETEEKEKNMLQILNPLPPLPQEEIQKLTEIDDAIEVTDLSVETSKSYILEANNARESVIFGPDRKPDKKNPENEYVHKIRKANMLASQKEIPLPPIDERKIIELEKKSSSNNLDIGMPSKNMEVYKKILYERMDSRRECAGDGAESGEGAGPDGRKIHWRRKMKMNINW